MERALSPNRVPPEGMKDHGVRRFLAVAGLDVESTEHAEKFRDHLEWLEARRTKIDGGVKWRREFRQKAFYGIIGFLALTAATTWVVPQLQEVKWSALFR